MTRRRVVLLASAGATVAALTAALLVARSADGSSPATIDAGTHTCTTDGSGFCAGQTHDLGTVPVSVVATAKAPITGTTVQTLDTDSFTAVTFRVRAFKANGSALTNAAISYSYAAFSGPAPTPSPTPSTSASSSPTVTTSPPPPASFPDASNTGVPAGTVLTVVNGDMTIDTAGTVVDGKDIRGCVTVTVPGVVIKNSKVSCPNAANAVSSFDGVYSGTPLIIQDSEVTCLDGPGTAIGDTHIVALRVDVHGCENGFDLDMDIDIADSYVHDLYNTATSHSDDIQFGIGHCPCSGGSYIPGALDVTIRHNTLYARGVDGTDGTSAIISNRSGADTNILIDNNLMAGGAYTLYCEQGSTGINYRVTGNHFSTVFHPTVGAYGPSTDCSDETQSGNVIHETGQPITLQ
jgi:hypothetical protein